MLYLLIAVGPFVAGFIADWISARRTGRQYWDWSFFGNPRALTIGTVVALALLAPEVVSGWSDLLFAVPGLLIVGAAVAQFVHRREHKSDSKA